MSYIWQNKDWPSFNYDIEKIKPFLKQAEEERNKTVYAFSVLNSRNAVELKANLIAQGISASLEIENETVDIDSIISSVSKRLSVLIQAGDRSNAYSDNLVEMISDAFENKEQMSAERLLFWQKKLFENQAGLAKKTNIGFRQGPEYILRNSGKTSEVIYEAIPAQNAESETYKLIDYINESADSCYIKAAVCSLWFVLIHPFEDGNGRISRALADYVLLKDSREKLPYACLSAEILKNRKEYYSIIQDISSQSDSLDITVYITWFIKTVTDSYMSSRKQLSRTITLSAFIGSLDPSEYNSRELHMLFLLASGKFRGKITNAKWSKINKCSNAASFRDIQHLTKNNLLISSGEAGPKTGYLFNEEIDDTSKEMLNI